MADNNKIYKAVPADYGKFEVSEFNRPLRNNADLVNSMKTWGYLRTEPLVVRREGGKYKIRKGHHRYAVAVSLGIPFYYIIEEKQIPIQDVESIARPWTPSDYIRAYANEDNRHYQELISFHEKTGISLSMSARLLSSNGSCGGLKNGDFAVSRDRALANSVAAMVAAIREINPRIGRNTHCVHALLDLCYLDYFNPATMIRKIQTFPGKMLPQVDVMGYLRMLEEIYNYSSRNETKVDLAGPAQRLANVRRRREPASQA